MRGQATLPGSDHVTLLCEGRLCRGKDGGRGRMSSISQQVITWPRLPSPCPRGHFCQSQSSSHLGPLPPSSPNIPLPPSCLHLDMSQAPQIQDVPTRNSSLSPPHTFLLLFSPSSSNQLTQHLGGHRVLLILQLTVCISYPEYFCSPQLASPLLLWFPHSPSVLHTLARVIFKKCEYAVSC